ncbi:hypothetical protein AVEN_97220-1 [Araneus ventricosus]|uniref:Reverse transcriptase domain-containing protein n=1 Tax=Araneus ventricosus TaxID=182803 RepID=A0A4Y2GCR8_ARAVE|nr:hypothetical protein AVEN_97220-1 [Araneus ventricosus]
MLKFRHFPNCWKTARVLPILKPGKDPTHLVSYRPISLLPTLSKLGEKLILNRSSFHFHLSPNVLDFQMVGPVPQGAETTTSYNHFAIRRSSQETAFAEMLGRRTEKLGVLIQSWRSDRSAPWSYQLTLPHEMSTPSL